MGGYLYFQISPAVDSDYYPIQTIATHASGENYVGSETCKKCHADIYNSHFETAHYRSSDIADSLSVKGDFAEGKNHYSLNDSISFKMVLDATGISQETWVTGTENQLSKSKIDVVIGSGTKGQSHLSWDENKLYQLQVSYFTPTDSWTNSPGISMELMERPREVNAKCLECHTTFAKNTSLYGMGNSYDRSQIIFGIDCERCHGPAEKHAVFHTQNPTFESAKYIIKHDTLTRQQHLDACALCHSGVRMDIKPAFLFKTGDKLREFSLPGTTPKSLEDVDVHGNQYDLLRASACFKQTPTMDCTSCHDIHKNERGNTASFNSKCMACHTKNSSFCTVESLHSDKKNGSCIACHMPLIPSKSMFIQIDQDSLKVPVQVRTHLIDIYTQTIADGNPKK